MSLWDSLFEIAFGFACLNEYQNNTDDDREDNEKDDENDDEI